MGDDHINDESSLWRVCRIMNSDKSISDLTDHADLLRLFFCYIDCGYKEEVVRQFPGIILRLP